MSIEDQSIDPKNQALGSVVDVQGTPFTQEVLAQFLRSRLYILIGEPNSGKSTLAAELSYEGRRLGIRVHEKKYDHILSAHIRLTGSHEEGEAFNNYAVSQVEHALDDSEEDDIVLVEFVGIGNVVPKDRCVSATNKAALLTSNTSVLGVMAPVQDQFSRSLLRVDIIQSDPADVLDMLEEKYNTVVHGIPFTVSKTDMGRFIQIAVLGMAQQLHVAQILHEVISQGLAIRKRQYLQAPPALRRAQFHTDSGTLSMELKTLAMGERLDEIPLPDEAKLLVVNLNRGRRITLYAEEFLSDRGRFRTS